MKKATILVIILMLVSTGLLCGCEEKSSNEVKTVDANLNTLGLTVDDLSGDFEITDENYTTEPYVVEEASSPLKGEYLLERYEVSFEDNETGYFVGQNIVRFESNEKAKNATDEVRTTLKADFPEQSMETLGEKSYFGKITQTTYGTSYDVYMLVFSIKDVVVLLGGTAPLQANFIGYGKIIESNIMDAL